MGICRSPAEPIGLTPAQQRVFGVVRDLIQKDGCSPTVREIASALGHTSPGSVHVLLRQLQDRGAIRKAPRRQRGITIIDHGHRIIFAPDVAERLTAIADRERTSIPVLVKEIVRAHVMGDAP